MCTATGSTAACRCSAVAALQHVLATHGHSAAVKQELLAANGLPVLVQMLGRDKLPLACRAAAAGCIYHFLAPQATQQLGGTTAGSGGIQAGLQKGRQGPQLPLIISMQSAVLNRTLSSVNGREASLLAESLRCVLAATDCMSACCC